MHKSLCIIKIRKIMKGEPRMKKEIRNNGIKITNNLETLEAVHTHTHTHTCNILEKICRKNI